MKNKLLSVIVLNVLLSLLVGCVISGNSSVSITNNNTKETKLIINEVVTSNRFSIVDSAVGSPDWIEIFNNSSDPINLEGYGLSDNTNNFHKFVFPQNVVIQAGDYLIVYGGNNNGIEKTNINCIGFNLSKNGDKLYLTDPFYELLDQMEIPQLNTDISFARKSDGTFGYCKIPTPGKANIDSDISSSMEDITGQVDENALIISEVMPTNAYDGPWAELQNISDNSVNLCNYFLSDSSYNLMKFQLPDYTVAPGMYVIVYLDGNVTGEREIEAPFKLGKKDDSLFLSCINGNISDTIQWDLNIPNGFSVVKGDQTTYTTHVTKGDMNSTEVFDSISSETSFSGRDPLYINEVLQKNKYNLIDADGDRNEWVELYNSSDESINLKNYYLSDTENNLFKYGLPDLELSGGSYIIVFLSGKNRSDGELHSNFSLGSDETSIFLTNISTMSTQAMPLMDVPIQNVSVGFDDNKELKYFTQPTPGSKNGYGYESADQIGFFNKNGIFISEVSAISEKDSHANDWVELYNGSDMDADLSGWHLSDDSDCLDKWTFPEGTIIKAHTYLSFDATSHQSRQSANTISFSLSSSGETLVLTDKLNQYVDSFETGVLSPGITSGRIIDDNSIRRVFFSISTKGTDNSSSINYGYASQPLFSDNDLYHSEGFQLVINTNTDSGTIYYTTDGSKPDSSSKQYTEPLNIVKNIVIRAVTYENGRITSPVTTATYIFEEEHSLPVVAVAIDPHDFKTVSHATYNNKPEREAYISYYGSNGKIATSFPAGLKAKGQGTISYSQKSFSMTLRGRYGQSSVTYPFFDDCPVKTFSSLVIRNGGQDYSKAKIRDSYCSRIVRGMNLDYAAVRFVAVYINGSYWGLYSLNEELNSDYLINHYQVDSDDVDFVKRNQTELKGSRDGYLQARSFAQKNDLANDDLFEQFSEMVDVDYCTDYIIAQTFIVNSDMFNQKFWHTKDEQVKWRPVFYDLDFGFQEESSASRDLLPSYFNVNGVPSNNGSLTNMDVFVGLKKNKAWRWRFIERYIEIVCSNFKKENLLKVLDEMIEEIKDEMPRHINRWGHPDTYSEWEKHISKLRDRLEKRPDAAIENLRKYFKLSQDEIDAFFAKYSNTD